MNLIYTSAKTERQGRIVPNGIHLKPNTSIYLLAGMELETGNIVIAKKEFIPEVPQGVTIPLDVLKEAGINPDSVLEFTSEDGTVIVQEAKDNDFECDGDCENCPFNNDTDE